jgi:hypothetical protein
VRVRVRVRVLARVCLCVRERESLVGGREGGGGENNVKMKILRARRKEKVATSVFLSLLPSNYIFFYCGCSR